MAGTKVYRDKPFDIVERVCIICTIDPNDKTIFARCKTSKKYVEVQGGVGICNQRLINKTILYINSSFPLHYRRNQIVSTSSHFLKLLHERRELIPVLPFFKFFSVSETLSYFIACYSKSFLFCTIVVQYFYN